MKEFKDPSAKYRGLPFWSWNCKITRELIDEQLPIFKDMGFGGVVIHPREGLDTIYLGDEFMSLVKYTVDRCKELGILCWIYDDDRFPSGAADGLVTKDPRFRARQLRLTKTRPADGYCNSREEFEAELARGLTPRGYYLAAYDIVIENNRLSRYSRLYDETEISCKDNIRYAYLELAQPSQWFNGQTYLDTMSPEAVDEFIRVTHERYKRTLGIEFGKCAEAVFTDEPRIGKQQPLRSAQSDEDGFVPYNEYFAERFKNKNGFDALDIVPELLWDKKDGSAHNRLLYRDMVTECFAEVFMDRICRWCRENGIIMTGHILSESPLSGQTTTVGEAMRSYRSMDIPGIDLLIDGKELTSVKQAASVAAQNGTADTMSEEYGVTNWDASFKTFKLQGDWQAALGITKRVIHLSHMSLEGEAKRDWPGSIFFHAPWYREFSSLETYFSRLNTALTQGKRQVRIGVIHPIESLWLRYSPDDVSRDERRRLDREFTDLAKWLLYSHLDFEYISESLLPGQGAKCTGSALAVGHSCYDAVIVPDMLTIRSSTLSILEKLADRGGTVIFAGSAPSLTDGEYSDRAGKLAERCVSVPYDKESIIAALSDFRDVEITNTDGSPSEDLFYQLRTDENGKWLFISHVCGTNASREEHDIIVSGSYYARLYDAMTGGISSIPEKRIGGKTIIKWSCGGEDSILLRLMREPSDLPEHAEPPEPETVLRIRDFDSFELYEPNVLLLDCAEFSIDGGEMQERDEILRAENKIRRQLGFFERTGMDIQPYATSEGKTHTIRLRYEFSSQIAAPARLAVENPQLRKIYLNGKEADNSAIGHFVDNSIKIIDLPDIQKEKNELIVEVRYNQKTFLENMYLLGDFGVDKNRTVTAPMKALTTGDITEQGLPHYTGSIGYTFEAELPCDGEYFIRVPEFSAPALSVSADGKNKGLIAYSPHRISVGKMTQGKHVFTVKLYGNRFNAFGMLHNANENYTWYGNGSYRTTGSEWTYDYMLRSVGIMSDIFIEKL